MVGTGSLKLHVHVVLAFWHSNHVICAYNGLAGGLALLVPPGFLSGRGNPPSHPTPLEEVDFAQTGILHL